MNRDTGLWNLQRARSTAVAVAGGAIFLATCVAAQSLSGPAAEPAGLDLWSMITGLLGGLALFLFGIEQMSDALKALAANRLKDILERLEGE